MPTYEYLCKSCSHRFEKWQKMTDEPLLICPECGGSIRRVFYPAGIVFKGSGFYKTDHGVSSVVDPGDQATKKENGTAAASETKSTGESKPASTEVSRASTTKSEHKLPAPTK